MEEENNPIKMNEPNEKKQNENPNEERVYEAEVVKKASNTNAQNSEKKNNNFALASFICSMVGLLIFGIPCGIAAIVTGIIGLVKFDSVNEKNRWMAIVGLIVGIFDFVIVVMYNTMKISSLL